MKDYKECLAEAVNPLTRGEGIHQARRRTVQKMQDKGATRLEGIFPIQIGRHGFGIDPIRFFYSR